MHGKMRIRIICFKCPDIFAKQAVLGQRRTEVQRLHEQVQQAMDTLEDEQGSRVPVISVSPTFPASLLSCRLGMIGITNSSTQRAYLQPTAVFHIIIKAICLSGAISCRTREAFEEFLSSYFFSQDQAYGDLLRAQRTHAILKCNRKDLHDRALHHKNCLKAAFSKLHAGDLL